jgi:Ca2+-binding RTX toxin-like protein
MAIKATFSPTAGVLSVFGSTHDDTIVLSRDAAGALVVNGGAVHIKGGVSTVANTGLIQVFGQAGDDTISIDETNGAMPAAQLFGGDGNDVLTGGSAADRRRRQRPGLRPSGRRPDDLEPGGRQRPF